MRHMLVIAGPAPPETSKMSVGSDIPVSVVEALYMTDIRSLLRSVQDQLRRLVRGEIDDLHLTRTESGRVLIKASREDDFEAHEVPEE